MLWKKEGDCEDCAPPPNGLVHGFLGGLTLGGGACCPVRWLSRVHSCVAQGPITHRWFTAFAPKITPRRVFSVFDCGRTHGVRHHRNFTVAQPDVAGTVENGGWRAHIKTADRVSHSLCKTSGEQQPPNEVVAHIQYARINTGHAVIGRISHPPSGWHLRGGTGRSCSCA